MGNTNSNSISKDMVRRLDIKFNRWKREIVEQHNTFHNDNDFTNKEVEKFFAVYEMYHKNLFNELEEWLSYDPKTKKLEGKNSERVIVGCYNKWKNELFAMQARSR